jgi:hypothetical protein
MADLRGTLQVGGYSALARCGDVQLSNSTRLIAPMLERFIATDRESRITPIGPIPHRCAILSYPPMYAGCGQCRRHFSL